MLATNVGRNDPCPCGSGKRYKECHGSLGLPNASSNTVGPQEIEALLQQAHAALQRQDHATASARCRQVLGANPNHPDAWYVSGVIDLERGDFTAALKQFARAIEILPARAEFHANLARTQFALGLLVDAVSSARRATVLDAANADGWNVLGLCLEPTEPAAALAAWERAGTIAPRQLEAHFRIGNLHRRERNYEAAVASYRRASASGRKHPVLSNNLGLALQEQGNLAEAERCYRDAVLQQPGMLEANANLGGLLLLQGRFADAIPWYERAVALSPLDARLWSSLGTCQHRIGALAVAGASFERALEISPDDPKTMVNMASMLLTHLRYQDALPMIEKALAREPGLVEAQNMLLYVHQHVCNWENLDQLFERQRAHIGDRSGPPVAPHNLLALPYTPGEQLVAARDWVARRIAPKPATPPALVRRSDDRLRIGYLGADFREHPLANLLTEVVEKHDRTRFEVFGYSFGPDDRSAARARFGAAFDRFVDVRSETFAETAQRIRQDQIAILFDTGGHVIYARGEIFAMRPAPIQINCIGFPGTLGAAYYDYILTDRFVTPPEQQAHFTERFMYLPHCYMPGDTKRPVAAIPSRAECGLPDAGFVFCCFNGSYKIHPDVFHVWMRLLEKTPRSVLWLLEADPMAQANLRQEARRRNVSPDRLVFAPRVPLAGHLARHSVADLFLDTVPCNAHTTANDALFAGLPVVTCAGETFASRVSGSHLLAIGLPELVTGNLADYEALAQKLALDPDLMAGYRARLRANRATYPLFDTTGYTRALEELLWKAADEYPATA